MGAGLYFTDLQSSIQEHINVYNTPDMQDINQWIDALYYAQNGRLYIGTYDGIKCIDTQNLKVVGQEKALLGLVVYSIIEDHEHRIWAGTSDGITVMDKDLNILEQFTIQNGLPNNSVSSIVVDKTTTFGSAPIKVLPNTTHKRNLSSRFMLPTAYTIMNSPEMRSVNIPTVKSCLGEPTESFSSIRTISRFRNSKGKSELPDSIYTISL